MNLYLDASALVKRYLTEPGSLETEEIIQESVVTGTTVVSRAEVAAAFSKAVRTEELTSEEAVLMLEAFQSSWMDFFRLDVSNEVAARAERLAFGQGLRGYDAVQLASALVWRDAMGEEVIFATFDLELWEAAGQHPLALFPEKLPALLETWRRA